MTVSQLADRRLLESARAGDPDTWEALYRSAYPGLFGFARRRLATEDQAEEAVSETMVRAMGRIGGYVPGAAGLQGWLFGILRNVVLEAYRSGSRTVPSDPARMYGDVDPDADPVLGVLAAEEHRCLAAAFGRLSEQDRELLELRVVLGLDAEQVGALVEKRAGTVRTAQSRALQRLRVEYEGLMA